jgi:ribosome-binding protein aMBF1 (putative translation factor)
MSNQDWIPVSFRRHTASKKDTAYKVDQTLKIKHVTALSLQSLIRKRIELSINQTKADSMCSFPKNTFKDIESNRLIPTNEQCGRIYRCFNIQLEIEVIDTNTTNTTSDT